jgi:hypothetical protein
MSDDHPGVTAASSRGEDPVRSLGPEADPGPIGKRPAIVRIGRFVAAHFATYRRLGKWPFLWRISLEGMLVPCGLLLAADALFSVPHRTDLDGLGLGRLFLVAVVLAPFFETLVSQALPIMLVRRCGGGFWTQVFTSVVVFAVCHLSSGISTVIFAGVLGGFYHAFTYAHWRETSFRSALWLTAGSHALHNLTLIAIIGLADS